MARLFDDTQSEYLNLSSAIVTALPFSVSAWFYADQDTDVATIFSIGDISAINFFRLGARGDNTPQAVAATARNGGFDEALSTTGYTINTWHQGCAVFASDTDRRAFIDGGSRGNNTAPGTPSGLDTTSIGRIARSGGGASFWSGRIAEVGVWDVALTDDEVAVLGAGYAPPFVRPQNLIAYYPLFGQRDPEPDITNASQNMSLVNTPGTADHAPVIHPAPIYTGFTAAAAVAAASPVIAYRVPD